MEDYKRSSWKIPGASTNSVYDDIFGGPPRFAGAPYVAATAASRVDEYSLIFGGRDESSIPVLDPPPVVEVAGSRSSGFDYDEIFRGFDGGNFGVPYEELFQEAEKSRDLPTRPDSEQEELKTLWVPSVRMNGDDVNFHDKNEDPFSTNRDSNHLPDSMKKSNMSNHKLSWRSDEINGVATHISQLHDVPGYRFVVDASSGRQIESIAVELSNGSLNGEVVKAEHLKKDELCSISSDCSRNSIDHLKTFQDPCSPYSNASSYLSSCDLNQSCNIRSKLTSSKSRLSPTNSFIAISDINIQSQSVCAPPPLRPLPELPVKQEWRTSAKLKVDKGFHGGSFSRIREREEAAKDRSPPFLDVEVDAGSAAAASLAAMNQAMEQAEMRMKRAKESMQRKKDNLHNHKNLVRDEYLNCNEHRAAQEVLSHKRETAPEVAEDVKMHVFSGKDIPETIKKNDVVVEFEEKEKYIETSAEQLTQGKQFCDFPAKEREEDMVVKLKVEKHFFEMEQEANSKKIQDFSLAEGKEKLKAVGHTIRQERSQKKVVVDKKLRGDRESCVLKEITELKTANSEKSKRSAEETYELDETGKTLKTDCQAYDHKESDKNLAEEAYKYKENEMKLREAIEAHDHEDKENMGFLLKAEIEARECEERGRNCVDIEKRLDKEDCVLEERKKKHKEAKGALEHKERERNIGEEVQKIEDNEKTLVEEAYIHEENEKEALEREEREKETINEAQGLKRNGISRNTTMDRKNGSRQVDSKLRQAENGREKNEYESNRTSAHVLHKEENIENGSGVIKWSHNIRVDMSHNLEENEEENQSITGGAPKVSEWEGI